MMHSDFSVRSARDEVRHIIGSSKPHVIVGSQKDQTGDARRRTNITWKFMCELYEAQVASGRYFVHELTSEVNSRMRCVTRIMAMLGTRTILADLCMFG